MKKTAANFQFSDANLINEIKALQGSKTNNQIISEMLVAYKEKLNSTVKQPQRRTEIDATEPRKVVNHTELFLQILAKAKQEFSVKPKKVIPISYFTNRENNKIGVLHYDVVKSLCESLNIDLKQYAQ